MKTKKILPLILLSCISLTNLAQTTEIIYPQVSPTRYDYSDIAKQIVRGCADKYEQAKAIYRWLCTNISYDTTYSIYTADECWDHKRGVCQAYCELFYRLAEPLGLEVCIVSGVAKTADSPDEAHAWVFATVEGNAGILIDPTWGAGSVEGDKFTRSIDDMSWFHVDPYWMIFTHFPNDTNFQFLPKPIDIQTFKALPRIRPMWGAYGFHAQNTFEQCMNGKTDFPEIYDEGKDYILLTDVPLTNTLRIGQKYTFALQKLQDCTPALINGDFHQEWDYQDGTYHMEFIPSQTGEVRLSIQKGNDKGYWCVLNYTVAPPTQADWQRLERHDPYRMPEITRLGKDIKYLQKYGIDGSELLAAVRNGQVSTLPTFYSFEGKFTAIDIPLNGILQSGKSYTFRIRPYNGLRWVLINEGDWHEQWEINPDNGTLTLTVTPKAGSLNLAAQFKEGSNYMSCLKYIVE